MTVRNTKTGFLLKEEAFPTWQIIRSCSFYDLNQQQNALVNYVCTYGSAVYMKYYVPNCSVALLLFWAVLFWAPPKLNSPSINKHSYYSKRGSNNTPFNHPRFVIQKCMCKIQGFDWITFKCIACINYVAQSLVFLGFFVASCSSGQFSNFCDQVS